MENAYDRDYDRDTSGGIRFPRQRPTDPLLSLPEIFGTDLTTVPADIPYLGAPADRLAAWARRFAAMARPRVGLVWAGNPKHKNDRNRSCPPALLEPRENEPSNCCEWASQSRPFTTAARCLSVISSPRTWLGLCATAAGLSLAGLAAAGVAGLSAAYSVNPSAA